MIIQGSNIPIKIELELPLPASTDIALSLMMPGYEIKHWDTEDMIISEDRKTIDAPITQEESMEWELGRCKIEFKWIDEDRNIMHAVAYDQIYPWQDKTMLEGIV